jgi:DNA-binding transcriptional ArsR family regulator
MHQTLSALAEPNRFRIVEYLRSGAATVGTISRDLQLRQPQVSKHLQLLKTTGLVTMRPAAQQRVYQLAPERFAEMDAWLERYRALWVDRFSHLDIVIAEIQQRDTSGDRTP